MAEGNSSGTSTSTGSSSDTRTAVELSVVKGYSAEYFLAFEEACEAYLTRNFPEWRTADKAYMFPPAFPFRYEGPTGEASGAVPLTRSEEEDMKGDFAELQVFNALDKFGRQTNQPMFVLASFKFREFIEHVLRKNLPERDVCSLLDEFTESELSREIDLLVFHRRIGIIIFEVKAMDKFKANRYNDAKKQLEIVRKFIDKFLELRRFHVPLYKVIALPNVAVEGRSKDFIDLRRIDLCDSRSFEEWWMKSFSQRKFTVQDEQNLLKLAALFIGQRVSISAVSKIMREIFSTIDSQRFLHKSHEKTTKQAKEHFQPIPKTSEEPHLVILARQFIFLNPQQLSLWEGPKHQLFCGPSGTGKTILLQHKALECTVHGEEVVIVVPSSLEPLYKEFFKRNEALDNVTLVTYKTLSEFSSGVCQDSKFHLFVDEFQFFFSTSKDELDLFSQFLQQHQDPMYFQWIAYDIHQTPTPFSSRVSMPRYLMELVKNVGFQHAECLQTIVRSTLQINQFVQSLAIGAGYKAGHPEYEGVAHIGEIMKEWYKPMYPGHHVTGPEVITKHITMPNTAAIWYSDCARLICTEIDESAKGEDQYCYYKVGVLVAAPEWVGGLQSELEKHRIPVCCVGDSLNAVVVDWAESARSYEWPVVVSVWAGTASSYNLYLQYSRAITKLICIVILFEECDSD